MTVAIYMALVGYGVMVGIPVISTAWVSLLGFSEVQVGRVAGADLGGFSLGAILVSRYVARVNRRYLVLGAAFVAVVANALCTVLQTYEQTLVLRVIAGIGSGAYTAVAVATLAGTVRPARAFNILLFSFAFSQGGALYLLPKLSMNAIYLFFIVTYILGLMAIRWLPAYPIKRRLVATSDGTESRLADDAGHITVPKAVPWLVLAAVLFTYINIGAYWTYIELASAASGTDPDWVGKLLVYTSVFSVVGCACATLISNRFGLARPLIVTLLAQAGIVGMLAGGINNINIMISMFAFNFCWIFVDVYQSATIANLDSSGRFAALMPGAQGLGQILGPNLAATILAVGLGYGYIFVLCAIASLVGLAIYLFMYFRLRKQYPALADAS